MEKILMLNHCRKLLGNLRTLLRNGLRFYIRARGDQAHENRLQATEKLPGLLDKCLNANDVYLIETPVDYLKNKKVLIDELKFITCIQ
jgi:hypothetical protein